MKAFIFLSLIAISIVSITKEGVVWTNFNYTSSSQNLLTKDNRNGWDGSAHSIQRINRQLGGEVEFEVQTASMVGFYGLTDTNTTVSYQDIKYAFSANSLYRSTRISANN